MPEPQIDLEAAANNVRQRFPRIGRQEFKVERGTGEGFAEFYPTFESRNPQPGTNLVQIRRQDLSQQETESVIAGEVLHLLGGRDPRTGQAFDPEFRAVKERFIQALTPGQLAFDRARHQARVERGIEVRSFDAYLDQVAVDQFLRGYLFPDRNAEFLQPGMFTPQQLQILQEAQALLAR